MDTPLRILLVEDCEDDAELLLRVLRRGGYTPDVRRVETEKAMAAKLDEEEWDLVVADYSLPQFNPLSALELLKERQLDVPFIVVSGVVDRETAAACMKAGAHDYLMKDDLTRQVPAVDRELLEARHRRRRKQLEREVRTTRQELEIAGAIQRRLFPETAPELPGFDIGGLAYPAECAGGDYYDYFPMKDDSLGIAVGDASGHGIGPALVMAETRAFLRALAQTETRLDRILANTNRLLWDCLPDDRFVTLLLARLDPRSHTLEYVSAGHQGFVLDAGGTVKHLLKSTGLPLGLEPEATFPEAVPVKMAPGDVLLLMTDGIQEGRSPEGTPFGLRRAFEIVRTYRDCTALEIAKNLYYAARAFGHDGAQQDDMTVIVVRALAEAADLPQAVQPFAQARFPGDQRAVEALYPW